MKPTAVFSILAAAQSAAAAPISDATTAVTAQFHRLALDAPLNWTAGHKLFPASVMKGFHGEIDQYDSESWAQFILQQCKSSPGCKSTISFSGINSGSTGGRFWFGYVFSTAATASDFVRDTDAASDVRDSIAYSS